jgi:hypothetical protein
MQGDSEGKIAILESDTIGNFEKKKVHMDVCL